MTKSTPPVILGVSAVLGNNAFLFTETKET
jgi:hypothetical protein